MRISFIMTSAVLALASLAACGDEVSKAKIETSSYNEKVDRQDALNVMAKAVCDRRNEVEPFGAAKSKFASEDECKASVRKDWADAWSEEKCGGVHGPLAGKVRDCRDRAQTWESSSNILDFGGLLTECNAGAVCR